MVVVFYDTKIYQQISNSTINNHFVNKVSTTFFEKSKPKFLISMNINKLQIKNRLKQESAVKVGGVAEVRVLNHGESINI
jgi:hypothetical protein